VVKKAKHQVFPYPSSRIATIDLGLILKNLYRRKGITGTAVVTPAGSIGFKRDRRRGTDD